MAGMMRDVLARLLYTRAGRVRTGRMIGTVAVTVAFAIFGSFLLAVTPVFEGHHGIQIAWVLFAVALLKIPLIGFLWWFIVRNKEWPVKPPRWDDREIREILDYIRSESQRALAFPDAAARLRYLRGEAWHVADRVGGDRKLDAIALAIEIDRLALRPDLGARARR
jgi:hypothetical protein